MQKITDPRKNDVQTEFDILKKKLEPVVNELGELYQVMKRVNLFIWDMMDSLRDEHLSEEDYLRICKECIEYNDVRFRVKNKINNASNSSLREQKSYAISRVVIHISDEIVNIDEFIRPIKYFSFLYDVVVVISNNAVLRTEFNKDITVKFDETVDDYKHMFLFQNATYNKTEIYEIFKLNEAYLNRIIDSQ